MREKLFLAVMVTFALNLFLGVRLPATNQTAYSSRQTETSTSKTAYSSRQAETAKILMKLQQQEQAFRQKLLAHAASSYKAPCAKELLQLDSLFGCKNNSGG